MYATLTLFSVRYSQHSVAERGALSCLVSFPWTGSRAHDMVDVVQLCIAVWFNVL